MVALVDTNILVYRFDARFPKKQKVATNLLRRGLEQDTLRLSHQSILEFVAVTQRVLPRSGPLLTAAEARREAEELLSTFVVLYPDEQILRAALRGQATYGLSWFDAHLWAYAECNGIQEILSEDFAHGRLYGTVRIRNPFA